MKYIEDIRDKHQGEEIWVFGAGSSVDEYPLDFFEDKICIGVNWIFFVFIDVGDEFEKFSSRSFYSVHEHRECSDWIAKYRPDFLKSCFFLLPPERRDHPCHMVWWEDYNSDPYYMRWGLKGRFGVSAVEQDFVDVAKCIMEKKKCHYICKGTTLHWAIQAAIVLGAKKVYVVGGEAIGDHMHKHGSPYEIFPTYEGRSHFLVGTKNLADAFEPYGIEIVHYRYGEGERKP